MDTFAECATAAALAVLLDPRTPTDERTDAAWVVRGLFARVAPTEALIADVGGALAVNLDAPGALARLLVVLRSHGVDTSRTKIAVAHAAELAFRQERFLSLYTLVLAAFDDPAWSEIARDEYGVAAFTWAISDLPRRRTEALMLLGGWTRLRDVVPEWASAEILRRPGLIETLRPPALMARRLHASAPTADGWRYIHSLEGADSLFAPDAFSASLQAAVETLCEAIQQEPDDATRVMLASWLSRLP